VKSGNIQSRNYEREGGKNILHNGTKKAAQWIASPTDGACCHITLPEKRQWPATDHRVFYPCKPANDPIFAPSFPGTTVTYTWAAPTQITYPGGSTRQIAHDPLLRIRRITAADPAGNPVQDYQYRYDPVGKILEKATEHGTYTYEYDPRDRLTRAANPTLPDEAWTYDDANALKAYANVTLQHDANGSTTQKTVAGKTTRYLYDLENRLTEVKDPTGVTIATYGYDPFGRRLWKDTGGTRTYFVNSEEGLVAGLDATGNVIQSYAYLPQRPTAPPPCTPAPPPAMRITSSTTSAPRRC